MLLTLSISIYTGHVQHAVANEADWIPDANLRTAVRTALGLGDADTLTQEAMTNLTELRAGNASIADITGLEHATNLTQLDLRNNSISSITALSGLTNLTHLWLAFNSITDISPIGSLTNLTTLTLRDNHIGNIADLGNLTNLTTLWIKNCGITDVTPLQNLTNLTTLRISGNDLTNAHLLSTLTNLNDIDITVPDPPPPADTTSPDVSITVPSDVQNAAFEVTITFTEAVSGFTQSGLSVGGTASVSITAWSTTDNTTFTAEVTPTGSGQVTLSIAAGVATDAANNQNTAATSQTVTVNIDNQSPSVSLSVPSGIQNGAFDATITFTEAVSDFVQGDVFLTGSRSSITAWSANRDSSVYTATITPTASGTVTVAVAAGVATDAANNPNTAATSQTVTIDVDAPAVTISLPSDVQNGAFDAMLTFSEAVSDFEQSDVSLTGTATASITAWNTADNTTYTAEITPTADGTVTLSVAINVATDAAGNSNTAAIPQTVAIDLAEPIPDPATWMPDANLRAAVRSALGITSDRNFSKDDLGTLTSLRVVQSQVTDITGLEYATRLTTLIAWGNQISSVTPLENLTRLTDLRLGASQISDVTPLEGLISLTHLALQRNNISNVTPLSQLANLTWLRLAGNPVTDFSPLSGLTSLTDTDVEIPESDTEPPSVSITAPSVTQNGAFDATITFTEAVSGFEQADLTLTGTATARVTAWAANSDSTVYTATITPTSSGTVILNIAASVATDAANNLNTAAPLQTVSVDVDAPTATIGVPAETQNGAFEVTITFTEAVSGFEQSELSLTDTANASITAWNTIDNITYTATVTPTISGTVTLSVPANVATDTANNPNTAATSQTVTVFVVQLAQQQGVDTDPPGVSITVPDGVQNSAFDVIIRFTEAVSGFEQSELSLGGTASASITAWSTNADDTVYTATITPTSSGTVILNIAASIATDAASNPNTAAISQTVSVDIESPGVSISVPSGVQTGSFSVSITFTEVVSDFEQSDLSLTGTATASITVWYPRGDTTYTATITPTTSGTVSLSIAAGVATDTAGNPNTASATQTVNVGVGSPSVTITVPEGVQDGRINAIITFSEHVSDFAPTDISLEGTAPTTISGFGVDITDGDLIPLSFTVYHVTIVAYTSGTVLIQVPAGVVTDVDGNQNTASQQLTIIVYPAWDVNEDGVVDDTDVTLVIAASGQTGDAIENPRTDVNRDGTVNATDEQIVRQYHKDATPPLIPDANLAAAIRDELDLAEHTAITVENMQSLSSLETGWNGVTDLTGLEHATNLITLELYSNSISDLTPLTGLTNLRTLYLDSNSISDLTPLTGLTNLRTLELDSNSISNLTPLTGLTNLRSLGLHKNQMTDITSVAGLTNLKRLYLGNNSISDFTPLTELTNLITLELDSNSISDLTPLTGLTNLSRLYLGNNSISDLTPLTGLTNLITLALKNNSISDLTPLTGLTNLIYLSLKDNSISDTSPLYPLTQGNLANLDIPVYPAWDVNENRVVDATDSALVTAALGQTGEGIVNPRTDVNRDGTVNAVDQQLVTDNIDQIVTVLDANLAVQIRHKLGLSTTASISVRRMLDLEELDADSAGISVLTGLEQATNLEKLTLQSNSISDISALANLTNLTNLDLDKNSISDISALANLSKLQVLSLSSNNISDISALANLTRLYMLHLTNNKNSISDISALANLSKLQVLSLSSNNISDISALANLGELGSLSLSFNNISDISALANLGELRSLSLSSNNISDISALANLTRLYRLHLRNNSISNLSPLARATNLDFLILVNNPILDTSPLYPLLEANDGKLRTVDIEISQYPPWDVNEDGSVDATDSALVTAALGQTGADIVNPRTDINGDGTVDADDLTLVTDNLDTDNGAPSSTGSFTLLDRATLETLDPAILEAQLEILRAESDGSLKYLRAIALLESVLNEMRPDETLLLANYPNPFNPETWIPYHLANAGDVQITIYDMQGNIIRQLDLGHQREGYYTSRSRAAYWDGRNAVGERVASGIYFYQLEADNMSLLRKMLILK